MIDKGFQDILLNIVIVVGDVGHPFAKKPVITHVLFGEAVAVMTADHWVGKVEVFDHRVRFPLVLFGHFAAEDHGDLLGLSDGSVQIQQSFSEFVEPQPGDERWGCRSTATDCRTSETRQFGQVFFTAALCTDTSGPTCAAARDLAAGGRGPAGL
jgi:hypothetical protein